MDSGPRLKAYIQSQWGRDKGGMSALADRAGVRRQTLYEWFRPGSTTEPSLSTLTDLARALGVRRVDVVAAMDGVTAPEQQEAPRPEWAQALQDSVDGVAERWTTRKAPLWAEALTDQIVSAIAAGQEDLIEAIAARVAADAARALDEGTDDEGQHGSGDQPGGPARPRPQLSP